MLADVIAGILHWLSEIWTPPAGWSRRRTLAVLLGAVCLATLVALIVFTDVL
jgi:hypothetical protein